MNGMTKDDPSYNSFARTKGQANMQLRQESNWLIHLHMVRQDVNDCMILIDQELQKSKGRSEYPNYVKGLIFRQDGKMLKSIECFKACQLLNPNNPQNLKELGYSLFLLGRNQEAVEKYMEANKLSNPKDWEILYRIGQCYLQMGDYEKAISYLKSALKLNNRNENIFQKLADIYIYLGNKEAAVHVYEEAINNNPTNADFPAKLSLLLLDGDENGWKKSLERLNITLAHNPQHSEALLAAGALLQDQGQIDLALAKYHTAVQNNGLSSALWNNIGLCFLGKKKYLAAVGCLKRASSINIFNADVAHNLGLINLSMGQFASAAMYLSQALSIARRSSRTPISLTSNGSKYKRTWIIAQGYMLLAAALNNLGDMKNAKRAHQMALSLESEDPLPVLSYAVFLWESQGKREGSGGEATQEVLRLLDEFHRRVGNGTRRVDSRMMDAAKQLKVALKQQNESME